MGKIKREVPMVKKIILVFKTHFDIGFTDLSSRVIDNYAESMLKEVIATCQATQHMGKLKYVWTMPSWPLKIITERCSKDLKKELDLLIEGGQIVWHALPFTSHTDFCCMEEYIEGLRYGRELSEMYQKPYKVSAKMTDVPGHSIMLPAILSGAGVKFLHLGCNQFATPPKLPFLFYWQAKSGEKVLTMYSKGGYGTPLLPPKDWDYPVWMALMQTHDNCGPQSASVIQNLVDKVREEYPEAEIVCGTMDDFYYEMEKYDLSRIPVIEKDLGDTWIHGIGSYPKEVAVLREDREKSKRLQALYAKQLLDGSGAQEGKTEEILNRYYENVSLFEEHTWGADVKTWLGPERVYPKKEFKEARLQENYRFMESSWQEQRERAAISHKAIQDFKILVESGGEGGITLFNPGSSSYTGWVSLKELAVDLTGRALLMDRELLPVTRIDGEWACYVKELPAFTATPVRIADSALEPDNPVIKNDGHYITAENHRYIIKFSELTGEIKELYDKKLEAVLLKQQSRKPVFAYRYDRYGIEDVTEFLREYAYRYSTWGIQDYGREAYPECEHKTYYPVYKSYEIKGDTLIFTYENAESNEKYGDADKVQLELTLPPAGDELFLNLRLKNKQETPYIESGSLLMPFGEKNCSYTVNKGGVVLNPETDIQEDANHVFYCVEDFISAAGENYGICIIPKDTPLSAIGSTGVYKFKREFKTSRDSIIYFNLFNNMWGTNFPQWIGGDLCYRYVLFGYDKDQEAFNSEKAAMLKEGIEVTAGGLFKDSFVPPEHMQLINVRKEKEGIVLRFRDLLGIEDSRRLTAENYTVTPVDLYNRAVGEPKITEYNFRVSPYGIYSFLLTKKQCLV